MKIVIKKTNHDYFETIAFKKFESLLGFLEKFQLPKEPYEVNLFAINEKINCYQLFNLKSNIEKLNISYLHIYSNNRETVLTGKSLKIYSSFASEVELKSKLLNFSEKQKDILHKGTVRSGDRISSNGDLYIYGDVNPGAIVSARRNIYVWGKLLGIASAGTGGDKTTTISSLYLKPLQLRIDDVVAIGPKEKPKYNYPEIAILEKEKIIIKPFIIET